MSSAISRLGLTRDMKGRAHEDTRGTPITDGEDGDGTSGFYEVTDMPHPPPSTDATSLAAKAQLIQHQITTTKDFFKTGRVFAIITPKQCSEHVHTGSARDEGDPSRHQIHVMLAAMNSADWCYCIRIRTYGRNGIKHLKADSGTQNCRKDDEARAVLEIIQKDIDAHAIVHTKELTPYQAPGEPDMKKRSLAVVLDPGLTHGVIDRMSRACFTRLRKVRHGVKVASVGRLDEISQACLWRYFEELTEGVRQ